MKKCLYENKELVVIVPVRFPAEYSRIKSYKQCKIGGIVWGNVTAVTGNGLDFQNAIVLDAVSILEVLMVSISTEQAKERK